MFDHLEMIANNNYLMIVYLQSSSTKVDVMNYLILDIHSGHEVYRTSTGTLTNLDNIKMLAPKPQAFKNINEDTLCCLGLLVKDSVKKELAKSITRIKNQPSLASAKQRTLLERARTLGGVHDSLGDDESFSLSEIDADEDKAEEEKSFQVRHEAHLVFFFVADCGLNNQCW